MSIEHVDIDALLTAIAGPPVIAAIDVAKEAMVVGFAAASGQVALLVRFSHPRQTRLFLDLVGGLQRAGRSVEAVMESTGVYGDSLRHHLLVRSIPVLRVDPKRCHDAAAVLDGVSSHHDAKSCTLIAHLHAQGLSREWSQRTELEASARALLDEHTLHAHPLEKLYGRLEAMTAAHWPELNAIIDQRTSWYLHLLSAFPGPEAASKDLPAALDLLRRKTFGRAAQTEIGRTVLAASESLGAPISEERRRLLHVIADRALSLRVQLDDVEVRMAELCSSTEALRCVSSAIGPAAAIAVFGDLGNPASYGSAAALEKAAGLNLRERSSGKLQGRLHLTKRGPRRVRQYLYLAALRMVLQSNVVRAWFEGRSSCVPGLKHKAVVAVMRKLLRAMFHVARGQPFDETKLFDTARLARRAHRAEQHVIAVASDNVGSSPCSSASVAQALPPRRVRVAARPRLSSALRDDAATARAMGGRMPPAGAPSSGCNTGDAVR